MNDETMTTFKRADGEPIGDYSWVTETDFLDDDFEPVELVEQTWLVTSERTFTYTPPGWEPPEEEYDDAEVVA